jgi:hypothetical protein
MAAVKPGPPDVAPAGLIEIGGGQFEEVLPGPQHRQVGIVQVEKGLQIGKPVPGEQLPRIGHRDGHPVARRHSHDCGRFQRAFHVDMQLGGGRALPSIGPGSRHGTPPCHQGVVDLV